MTGQYVGANVIENTCCGGANQVFLKHIQRGSVKIKLRKRSARGIQREIDIDRVGSSFDQNDGDVRVCCEEICIIILICMKSKSKRGNIVLFAGQESAGCAKQCRFVVGKSRVESSVRRTRMKSLINKFRST